MCKLLGIEKYKTSPWHPQTNGFLERSHKTLKTYLRSFVDKDIEWDNLLSYAMFCYNTTVRPQRLHHTNWYSDVNDTVRTVILYTRSPFAQS